MRASNPCLVTVAFSPLCPITSGLHDSKNIDGTQTRKKTVSSKQAQSPESMAQIGRLRRLRLVSSHCGEGVGSVRSAEVAEALRPETLRQLGWQWRAAAMELMSRGTSVIRGAVTCGASDWATRSPYAPCERLRGAGRLPVPSTTRNIPPLKVRRTEIRRAWHGTKVPLLMLPAHLSVQPPKGVSGGKLLDLLSGFRPLVFSSRRQGSTFIMMSGPFSTDGDACEQELR